MFVTSLSAVSGTDRDVSAETWRSRRLVLAGEGAGFSMHHTVMYAGTQTEMCYKDHIEAVYCVGGSGSVQDLRTGTVHPLSTGTLYLLDEHDRHVVRVVEDLHLVCVFTPALSGRETHDADGSYALAE